MALHSLGASGLVTELTECPGFGFRNYGYIGNSKIAKFLLNVLDHCKEESFG
jgi:hypothetical protein